jgi:hypothetical protein
MGRDTTYTTLHFGAKMDLGKDMASIRTSTLGLRADCTRHET